MTRELQEFIRDLKQEIRDMRERPVTPTLGHLERWISAYRPHRAGSAAS